MVGVVVQGVLDTLLNECDKTKALEYAKGMINDLLQNRIDISQLVITKSLSKKFDVEDEDDKNKADEEEKTEEQILQEKAQPRSRYSHNNIPHVRLVLKMRERDLVSAPIAGERVSFVIIKGTKGQGVGDLAEDPAWVLEHDLPINFHHYIHQQLRLPLVRIFEPIYGEGAEKLLFEGEHVRTSYQPKVNSVNSSALAKFTVVKEICLSCRKVLNPAVDRGDSVCRDCQPKKKAIYIERKLELNHVEK